VLGEPPKAQGGGGRKNLFVPHVRRSRKSLHKNGTSGDMAVEYQKGKNLAIIGIPGEQGQKKRKEKTWVQLRL